jgi:hypothetical protein
MTPHTLLALLQLGDGLFPAGGFAHSFGLETYAQEGRVRDRVGLEAFVTAHLEGAAGPRSPSPSPRGSPPPPTSRRGARSTRGSTR